MDSKDRKEFMELMYLFNDNIPVSEKRLLRNYDITKIDKAIEKGFIKMAKKDKYDKYYIITNDGKKFW